MEVSGHIHTLATLRKEQEFQIWTTGGLDVFEKRQNSWAYQKSNDDPGTFSP